MENKAALQDAFGRGHDYLRISISEHCNLRCTYCMPEDGIHLTPKPQLMTADEILQIAETFVQLGVKKIRVTGGEPLVRKDAKDILLRLGKLGVNLTITTNGILVPNFIDTFKAAGIKTVNISIDSLDKAKFNRITRRDYFEAVFENINLLLGEGFQVKLNVVLMKHFNDNEILDFIALTEFKKVQVRFIEFMPFNGNDWDKSKLVTYAEILHQMETEFAVNEIQRLEDAPNDTAKNFKIASYLGSFAIISSVTNPFCSTCNRIRLTADGKLKNCLFSNSETPLLETLRRGESILPLIQQNLRSKKPVRGGMEDDAQFQNPELFSQNRSMIAIGG
ncbi:GTP 3',8-cyclase MoaA [Flavobacterium sp. CYK-4]|uniref:GTP 3',8-cyclase MoaA n=1 Tax=Flavobacterium lotistagni TaxID=2709660 RepID=UPI0014080FDA|nr:GTP 3',8-cyclase MoaA [Flavobacterium lotistagni]NHM07099.1 GTP 3',8-cyclase MoaA [Flavobacterium lotistagni]